ncbi:MAG: K(+)-transporting ATPase subunit C [Vicinamibacteria bacterium]|jgi:K+-transporting ATPase ATPase C chain
MRKDFIAAAIAIVTFTVLFGLVYPLVITGVSQVAFPGQSDGSQLERDGQLIGSKLIGQDFSKRVPREGNPRKFHRVPDPRYFQSRPSVTGYSGDVTYFNNLGPNDAELSQMFKDNLNAYLELERPYDPGLTAADVPVDAVTTSASGVDPHISQANARIQANRIAEVRGLPLDRVVELIDENTAGRALGFLGEPGVNVLELNIALDEEAS